MTVIDLFAGAGGWDVAARQLGLDPIGIENDHWSCETRRAAGLRTIQADVLTLEPHAFGDVTGLIASPPCQTFSAAGNGSGRRALDEVLTLVAHVARGGKADAAHLDVRTLLVLEPLRWALELEPDWIALEQVPPVLPIWQAYAEVLRDDGYHVATGLLHAEQYGVPQTRKRAILMASRNPVDLPPPTHSRYHSRDPQRLDSVVLPWVSMGEALGWPNPPGEDWVLRSNYSTGSGGGRTAAERGRTIRTLHEPAVAMTSKGAQWRLAGAGQTSIDTAGAQRRGLELPAAAITGKGTACWTEGESRTGSIRLTQTEAAVLQSFAADHPWRGTKSAQFQQIGNAIPPRLAEAVLRQLSPARST